MTEIGGKCQAAVGHDLATIASTLYMVSFSGSRSWPTAVGHVMCHAFSFHSDWNKFIAWPGPRVSWGDVFISCMITFIPRQCLL